MDPLEVNEKLRYWLAFPFSNFMTSFRKFGIILYRFGTLSSSDHSEQKNMIKLAPNSGSRSYSETEVKYNTSENVALIDLSVSSSTPKTIGEIALLHLAK